MSVDPTNFTVRGKCISSMAQYKRLSWCDVYWHINTRQTVQSQLRCNRVARRIVVVVIIIIFKIYLIFSSESGFDINIITLTFATAEQVASKGWTRGAHRFLWGNLRETDYLEDLGVDGRIILK